MDYKYIIYIVVVDVVVVDKSNRIKEYSIRVGVLVIGVPRKEEWSRARHNGPQGGSLIIKLTN